METNNMTYETEAHMRARWPMIANLLVNIATLENDIYTAILHGKSYQWRAK